MDAANAVSLGQGSVVTVANGTALGSGSVATEADTIAFGHDAGDVSGYTVEYPTKVITTYEGEKQTVTDYSKKPTITNTTYSEAKYNRLVKVADGKDAHDAVTVGQLTQAVDTSESKQSELWKSDIQQAVGISEANQTSLWRNIMVP